MSKALQVGLVTARLEGVPFSVTKMVRKDVIKSVIREVTPMPFLIASWWSVVALRNGAEALGITDGEVYESEAYRLIRLYVNRGYFSMPRSLRKQVPYLVSQLLGGEN